MRVFSIAKQFAGKDKDGKRRKRKGEDTSSDSEEN